MSFSRCTGPSAAANRQASHLSDDFMFGFNIEDEEDREYLTEVAKHGIGHEDDIKGFVRLSLRRGIEEWEQAICCALAMRDRASFQNPLDGQDILTFLAKIYHVDIGSCHSHVQSPLRQPRCPNAKRKSRKICATPDAEIPLEVSAKKKRRVKKGTDSPYWKETSIPVREEDGRSENDPEAKVTTKKKAPKKCKKPLECTDPPKSMISVEKTGDSTATLACEDPKLTSVFLNDEHESLQSASFINTRGLVLQHKDNITGETPGDSGFALSEPELDTPMTRDLNELQSNIKSERTSELADIKVTQAPSDNEQKQPTTQKATPKRKAKSPYFENAKAALPSPSKLSLLRSPNKRPPRGTVSALPFPRLDSPRFGLIQEELADDPFRLLIAVTFLIRTSGKAAIPVFRALVARYPTPADLADAADTADIVAMIKHLGLGVVRAAAIQRHARTWLDTPPRDGVRFPVKGYLADPAEGDVLSMHDGGDLLAPQTTSAGWEIGHLTQGPYALDSWRIFCRDVLRGAADDWKGGGREGEFQPEWMRVLPADKELRACLRWMWMREGWLWDPATGEKTILPDELRRAVQDGRVGYDDMGNLRILDEQQAAACVF
ncbi:DNA glycosylase [Xylaria castorea]|nr:DNA glycosylase [Xylaria castorea]